MASAHRLFQRKAVLGIVLTFLAACGPLTEIPPASSTEPSLPTDLERETETRPPTTETETPSSIHPTYTPSPPQLTPFLPEGRLQIEPANIASIRKLAEIPATDVVFAFSSSDGNNLATVSQRSTDRQYQSTVWDMRTGESIFTADGSDGILTAFSPDGENVALSVQGRGISLRDLTSGRETRFVEVYFDGFSLALSPDWRLLGLGVTGAGNETSTILVKDLEKDQEVMHFQTPGIVMRLSFSPDGKSLVGEFQRGLTSGSTLWDVKSRDPLLDLPEFDHIAFSPDGRILAANYEGDSVFWEIASGRQLYSLPGEQDVRILPGGTEAITWTYPGPVFVWGITP